MYVVTFLYEDEPPVYASAQEGDNLFKIAKQAGIPIWAPCSGLGSCGKCRVQIVSGELNSPKSFYITDVEYEEGWRLACTSKISGDVTIRIN